MSKKDVVLASIEAFLWYSFLACFLHCIKNPVNIYLSAFILLILAYGALLCCPLVRYNPAWKKFLEG